MKKIIFILIFSAFIVGCSYEETANTLDKVSSFAATGQEYANKATTIAPAAPYANMASAVLGGVSAISAGIAAFCRMKQKKTEQGLKVVLGAVDQIPDVGKTIVSATVPAGVSDVVEKAYQSL